MSGARSADKAVRVLIVDDEPLARTRIRTLLGGEKDITIVGECDNGEEAVSAIASQHPDLVFLDIQMPELDGFGVIEEVGVDEMPLVIFVTAFDEHALKAFEVYALDYLLKPVDRDRFAETLKRAKDRLRADTPAAAQLQPLIDQLGRRQRRDNRMAIKTEGKVVFIRTTEIDWVEAVDDHARLHIGKETHVVRDTLARLEQRLPAGRFIRIHRSTIVNADRIKELQPWFQGDYVLILQDGTRLTSGRSYRQRVQEFVRDSM